MIVIKTFVQKNLLVMAIILVLVAFVIIITLFFTDKAEIDVEKGTFYKVSKNGASFYAFNSTPKKVIKSTKEYIKNSEYNSSDILFDFCNSKEHYCPDYPTTINDTSFIYYVVQIYKKFIIGYMLIDEYGNILETRNLMTSEELSKIQAEPEIHFVDACKYARTYLGLDEQALSDDARSRRLLHTDPDTGKRIFCYRIKFQGDDRFVYVNAITGEIVELQDI